MISMIYKILQDSKYSVREYDEKIVLFQEDLNYYLEDYVEVQRTGDKYIVFEVHRDSKQIKAETADKNDAVIYAVIICKRLFDDLSDRMVARNIRSYVDCGEEDKAAACIRNEIDESIYSIGREDRSKISLIKTTGNTANVMFANQCIVEAAALSRAYVVLYNYCKKLMHISEFYNEKLKEIDCSLSAQNIMTVYIFGE